MSQKGSLVWTEAVRFHITVVFLYRISEKVLFHFQIHCLVVFPQRAAYDGGIPSDKSVCLPAFLFFFAHTGVCGPCRAYSPAFQYRICKGRYPVCRPGEPRSADKGFAVMDNVLLRFFLGCVFFSEHSGQFPPSSLPFRRCVYPFLHFFFLCPLLLDHAESPEACLHSLVVLLYIAQAEIIVGIQQADVRIGVHPT